MPKLPLALVRPDQTLARPVTNATGVVLVQAGTLLTPVLIDRLMALGIDAVTVVTDAGDTLDGPSMEERLRELDARFAGHEQDPLMTQIKDIVARQLRGGRSADNA
jgi:hypothetical protein